ncbi:MAG: hypothetical protein ABJE47_01035 [bacterium]
MSTHMRRVIAVAFAALLTQTAGAQSVFDSELRFAPQFLQYQLKAPTNEKITELAVPVFVSIPFGSRFTFDVGTSYASAKVTTGSAVSQISGLTDTQLRGNLALGTDFVVITGGVNLPTGRSSVTLDQLTAAGRIGNDFLAFPISNMGTGLAATGGIAIARPMGDWSIGIGGAVRHSSTYDPFNVPGQSIRFTPGDEYRARIGADRALGAGRFSLGLTYSAFGDDDAGGSVYNTGNRLIAQTVVTNSYNGADITVAGYNVFRAAGNYASGLKAGRENILNGYLGVGLHTMGTIIEPSFEFRQWLQFVPGSASGSAVADRSQTSVLGTLGLRTRLEVMGLSVFPSGGYTMGSVATTDDKNELKHADLTGFKAQLAVRFAP